jgi:hypothetical protein
MEALFQIGKELGALTARVSALESKEKCGCGSKSKGLPLGALSNQQREILLKLRKSHKEIFAGINNVLEQHGLGDKIKVSGLRLVDVDIPQNPKSEVCCYCCLDGNYCCNADCTPCCDDKW